MIALPTISMRRFLEDPGLMGARMSGPTWLAWRALLVAASGEKLTPEEREQFTKLTGRSHEALEPCEEFLAIVGRSGGKSFSMAAWIIFLAVFKDYRHVLQVGEQPIVLCLSQTREQAKVVFDYCAGLFESIPLLQPLVRQRIAETLSLHNGIDIEIRAASPRGLRGPTCVAIVADELCWWFTEGSANSDIEILGAVKPTLRMTGGPFIAISTPHARRGVAYEMWAQHYGETGDKFILVAQGSTRDFNATFSQRKVNRAMELDPAFARAEYLGEWRDDVAAFISRAVVEPLVEAGVTLRPPVRGASYVAYADISTGAGADSYAVGIAHREFRRGGPHYVLDCLLYRAPPFSPGDVIREFAPTIKAFGCVRIVGDKFAKGFSHDAFRRHGLTYDDSAPPKSELYISALSLLTSQMSSLLDDKRMLTELYRLERRSVWGGKRESVDHPRDGHDDVVNAALGALWLATRKQPMVISDAALALAGGEGGDTRYAKQLRDVARLQRGDVDGIPCAWL